MGRKKKHGRGRGGAAAADAPAPPADIHDPPAPSADAEAGAAPPPPMSMPLTMLDDGTAESELGVSVPSSLPDTLAGHSPLKEAALVSAGLVPCTSSSELSQLGAGAGEDALSMSLESGFGAAPPMPVLNLEAIGEDIRREARVLSRLSAASGGSLAYSLDSARVGSGGGMPLCGSLPSPLHANASATPKAARPPVSPLYSADGGKPAAASLARPAGPPDAPGTPRWKFDEANTTLENIHSASRAPPGGSAGDTEREDATGDEAVSVRSRFTLKTGASLEVPHEQAWFAARVRTPLGRDGDTVGFHSDVTTPSLLPRTLRQVSAGADTASLSLPTPLSLEPPLEPPAPVPPPAPVSPREAVDAAPAPFPRRFSSPHSVGGREGGRRKGWKALSATRSAHSGSRLSLPGSSAGGGGDAAPPPPPRHGARHRRAPPAAEPTSFLSSIWNLFPWGAVGTEAGSDAVEGYAHYALLGAARGARDARTIAAAAPPSPSLSPNQPELVLSPIQQWLEDMEDVDSTEPVEAASDACAPYAPAARRAAPTPGSRRMSVRGRLAGTGRRVSSGCFPDVELHRTGAYTSDEESAASSGPQRKLDLGAPWEREGPATPPRAHRTEAGESEEEPLPSSREPSLARATSEASAYLRHLRCDEVGADGATPTEDGGTPLCEPRTWSGRVPHLPAPLALLLTPPRLPTAYPMPPVGEDLAPLPADDTPHSTPSSTWWGPPPSAPRGLELEPQAHAAPRYPVLSDAAAAGDARDDAEEDRLVGDDERGRHDRQYGAPPSSLPREQKAARAQGRLHQRRGTPLRRRGGTAAAVHHAVLPPPGLYSSDDDDGAKPSPPKTPPLQEELVSPPTRKLDTFALTPPPRPPLPLHKEDTDGVLLPRALLPSHRGVAPPVGLVLPPSVGGASGMRRAASEATGLAYLEGTGSPLTPSAAHTGFRIGTGTPGDASLSALPTSAPSAPPVDDASWGDATTDPRDRAPMLESSDVSLSWGSRSDPRLERARGGMGESEEECSETTDGCRTQPTALGIRAALRSRGSGGRGAALPPRAERAACRRAERLMSESSDGQTSEGVFRRRLRFPNQRTAAWWSQGAPPPSKRSAPGTGARPAERGREREGQQKARLTSRHRSYSTGVLDQAASGVVPRRSLWGTEYSQEAKTLLLRLNNSHFLPSEYPRLRAPVEDPAPAFEFRTLSPTMPLKYASWFVRSYKFRNGVVAAGKGVACAACVYASFAHIEWIARWNPYLKMVHYSGRMLFPLLDAWVGVDAADKGLRLSGHVGFYRALGRFSGAYRKLFVNEFRPPQHAALWCVALYYLHWALDFLYYPTEHLGLVEWEAYWFGMKSKLFFGQINAVFWYWRQVAMVMLLSHEISAGLMHSLPTTTLVLYITSTVVDLFVAYAFLPAAKHKPHHSLSTKLLAWLCNRNYSIGVGAHGLLGVLDGASQVALRYTLA